MKVLVSGASGFIGSALVARLRDEGHVVYRLVRKNAVDGDAVINLAERCIDTTRIPSGSLEGLDAVINLAGEPITPVRWSPAKRERIHASRVATTEVLTRSLTKLDAPPEVYISGSAIGFYGTRGDELLDEKSAGGEGFLADVCRTWEDATKKARESGIRVVLVRTGIVLGHGGALRPQLPLFRLGLGGRLGKGDQWMSFISLEDEVAALIDLIRTPSIRGPVNLVAPNPVRNRDFTKALGHALHRPTIAIVPKTALRLLMGRAVVNEVVCASQRVVPRQLQASGFVFAQPTIEDAISFALADPQRSATSDSERPAPRAR